MLFLLYVCTLVLIVLWKIFNFGLWGSLLTLVVCPMIPKFCVIFPTHCFLWDFISHRFLTPLSIVGKVLLSYLLGPTRSIISLSVVHHLRCKLLLCHNVKIMFLFNFQVELLQVCYYCLEKNIWVRYYSPFMISWHQIKIFLMYNSVSFSSVIH